MSRWLRLLGLMGVLLAAQLVIAMHGIRHLADVDHEEGEVCVLCLALANASGPPSTGMASVFVRVPHLLLGQAVPPRLTLAHRTHFLSRAPPLLQS